jgi:hypothetical protein
MTPAETEYRRAYLTVLVARARLLLQVSGADRDCSLADLLTFARVVGDESVADTVAAFRAAMQIELDSAQAELNRLTQP